MLPLEKNAVLVQLFGLAFVAFGWFALSLTLGSVFMLPLIALGLVLIGGLALFIAWKFLRQSGFDQRLAFGVALLAAIFVGVITEPTIFSGRDQGSIAEAAYRLAKNTELAFSTPGSDSFFQIYDKGTALNFPGFAYTQEGYLLTQFPLGYTAWLGSFVAMFDLSGFAIGNSLLFFLSLFFFYQLLRLFVHPYYAWAGFILFGTSFLPNWFAKITLTENLALFLFLFLIYNLFLFFQEGKFIFYVGTLLSAGLLAFTRIEGFALLFLSLLVLFFHPHGRTLIRTYTLKALLLPSALFIFFLLRDLFLNLPYYKMIGKALAKFLQSFSMDTLGAIEQQTTSLGLGSVFLLYGLLVLSIVGFFGMFLFLKERRFLLLLPTFIALPTFLYLFHPNITPDHPWMLRRYLFSLFPTLLFSAVIALAFLFNKDRSFPLGAPTGKRLLFASLSFLGLFFLQFPAWHMQLFYAEHTSLRNQVASFAKDFSDQDLILIDRTATGDGFSMLSGPGQFLFGKNTVYFFNPYDLSALDTSRFERVYLLTPEENQSRYAGVFGERLVYIKSITFLLEHLEVLPLKNNTSLAFPRKKILKTRNTLFQIY